MRRTTTERDLWWIKRAEEITTYDTLVEAWERQHYDALAEETEQRDAWDGTAGPVMWLGCRLP